MIFFNHCGVVIALLSTNCFRFEYLNNVKVGIERKIRESTRERGCGRGEGKGQGDGGCGGTRAEQRSEESRRGKMVLSY